MTSLFSVDLKRGTVEFFAAEQTDIKISFWNILTQNITDSKRNVYPKYEWKNRIKPLTELICQDHPHVMGFCECNFNQALDLKDQLKGEGYSLVACSSSTHQTLSEIEKSIKTNEGADHEFVGLIYDKNRLKLQKLICHELRMGAKHPRILVEASFYDSWTLVSFTVLVSHFDHLSMKSNDSSGKKEIELITDLENRKIPWFSVGDRNWPLDERGKTLAQEYLKHDFICDFKERTMMGHFGPKGTFAGHLWLNKEELPSLNKGHHFIRARKIDVGFRSLNLVQGVMSYTLSGEFSPTTYELLPENMHGDVTARNFASDHYYIGGIFRFKKMQK